MFVWKTFITTTCAGGGTYGVEDREITAVRQSCHSGWSVASSFKCCVEPHGDHTAISEASITAISTPFGFQHYLKVNDKLGSPHDDVRQIFTTCPGSCRSNRTPNRDPNLRSSCRRQQQTSYRSIRSRRNLCERSGMSDSLTLPKRRINTTVKDQKPPRRRILKIPQDARTDRNNYVVHRRSQTIRPRPNRKGHLLAPPNPEDRHKTARHPRSTHAKRQGQVPDHR